MSTAETAYADGPDQILESDAPVSFGYLFIGLAGLLVVVLASYWHARRRVSDGKKPLGYHRVSFPP